VMIINLGTQRTLTEGAAQALALLHR